jgi:uncharacterized membrane protein
MTSGNSSERWRMILRRLAAVFFIVAGTGHFLKPEFYVRIVPPFFPASHLLVLISGLCEIAGGVGLLIPLVRWQAGWGLIALLIAVFPANVFMAIHPERFGIAAWILWARLPLQLIFVAWVGFAMQKKELNHDTMHQDHRRGKPGGGSGFTLRLYGVSIAGRDGAAFRLYFYSGYTVR